MRAEYNPFIAATCNTFATVVSCELQRGAPRLQAPSEELFDVSAVIGLSGTAIGSVALSVSKEVALQATSTMLMTQTTEINADVVDAIGELTNMIAGSAKAKLVDFNLSISLPTVVTGKGHVLSFPREVRPICIPFESIWGPLKLEVCLVPVDFDGVDLREVHVDPLFIAAARGFQAPLKEVSQFSEAETFFADDYGSTRVVRDGMLIRDVAFFTPDKLAFGIDK